MTGNHVRLKFVSKAFGENHTMKENRGLCHLGLPEVFFCALKHKVGDSETQYFICFVEEHARFCICFVEILTHAYELSAPTGKTYAFICFV